MGAAAAFENAARMTADPIEHSASMLGKIIGGIAGFAAGVLIAFVLLSNPIGWAALGTMLVAGSVGLAVGEVAGKALGSIFPGTSGDIVTGSPNVSVGGRALLAARVKDPVKCHSGKKIAFGCATISINALPAARVKHKTECDGTVKDGCPTVKYGGPDIQVLAVTGPDDPTWYKWFKISVEMASLVFGGIGLFGAKGAIAAARAAWGAKTALSFGRGAQLFAATYNVADPIVSGAKAVFEGKFGEAITLAGGTPPSWLSQYDFTQTSGYRTANGVWTVMGIGAATTDAVGAFRARPDPPPVVQRELMDGQAFARTEGSNILLPDRQLVLPDVAPRIDPPPSSGGIILLSDAPRVSPPPPLVDQFGVPLPPSAPRVDPPPPPVPATPAAPVPEPVTAAMVRDERVAKTIGVADKTKGGIEWLTSAPPALGTPSPAVAPRDLSVSGPGP